MSEKAVMISIRPEWCELILNGKKTVEVRKTFPHDHMPFKCYIYCTKAKHRVQHTGHLYGLEDELYRLPDGEIECGDSIVLMGYDGIDGNNFMNGKVIAEFVCDRFDFLSNVATDPWNRLEGNVHAFEKQLVLHKARMAEKQLHEYANGKNVYAWHISNLKVYDKPKELREFHAPLIDHKYYHPPFARPPQSWCYCEEVSEN